MQKADVQWAVLAILILLVVALVIKPVATGQPVNLGLLTPAPTPVPPTGGYIQPTPSGMPTVPAIITTPIPTPTPVPTWDSSVQTVEFVDPTTYGINLNESLPNATIPSPDDGALRNQNLTVFATFSGQYSGTTQIIKIPFPYWELWYTANPLSSSLQQQAEVSGQYVVTPTQGEGKSMAGFSGSYSTAMPRISIQVMDAEDPNRIVRTITPPGSLDPELLSGEDDPRPWKEKFFEGQRSYYFIVKAAQLGSYQIDIKIPSSYIGKY